MRPRFSHHLQRLSKLSFQNIGRNLLLSVATSVMMGLILFIFNVILVLNTLTHSSLDALEAKVDLIVYISDKASIYEISEMIKTVQTVPGVLKAQYTSKEQALKEFLSMYPEKSDPFTEYGIENPLPGHLKIITEEPSQHETVLNTLEASAFAPMLMDIESSNENQEIVARLLHVSNFSEKLMMGVIVTFVFGSLLMIMNAIHLSIFTRKTEIQIMQLVGANPHMIRFPFMFEGAVYSFIAVLFSFILLIFFLEGTQLSEFQGFDANFNPGLLLGLEWIVSISIGVVSSVLALNFYLKHTLVLENSSS